MAIIGYVPAAGRKWNVITRLYRPPSSPQAIAEYVKAKFPDIPITMISRKWYGFEVELMDDLDLRFDKDGAFIGFDD